MFIRGWGEEEHAIILLSSLTKYYENIVDIMLYEEEIFSMGDVIFILNSKEIQRRNIDNNLDKIDLLLVRGRTNGIG